MSKASEKKALRKGLRIIALFEAAKGAVVLLAGCGILALIHKDLHEAAVQLVKALHFNPARHYPSVFIDAVAKVSDEQMWAMAISALAYSAVRLTEAYGLWKEQQWAEWFAVLSGGIYIPLEVYEVSREVTWPKVTILVVNLAIVAYVADVLARSRRRRRQILKEHQARHHHTER